MMEMTLLKYHLVCNAGFFEFAPTMACPEKIFCIRRGDKKVDVSNTLWCPDKLTVLLEPFFRNPL
jgi:hypothetical protein